jgi:hypothetical protein
LILKGHQISKPKMPLIAYQDLSVFKLFLVDVGLLAAMTDIHIRTLIGRRSNPSSFSIFKPV